MAVARSSLPPFARFTLLALGWLVTVAAPGAAAVKKVFLTSAYGPAKLSMWPEAAPFGGLAAGDQICRTLAEDATLPNFASYRAWLSTDTQDAYCRVAGYSGKKSENCGEDSLPDAGPWELVDGSPFVRSLSELTDHAALLHVPRVSETGVTLAPANGVHTGTSTDGTADPDGNCSGWVAASGGNGGRGTFHAGAYGWTNTGAAACGTFLLRLYCFEPGAGEPLPAFEGPGALVFLTSVLGQGDLGAWPDAGAATGLAAGDAICRARAAAGGLPAPQSFVAWLSDDGVDAIDRVTTDGPFKRLDGVQLSATKSGLVEPGISSYALETPIALDETGAYRGHYAWTGSFSQGERAPENCSNWTSDASSDEGQRGLTQDIRGFWTTYMNSPEACDVAQHLYCFANVVTIFWDGFETGNPSRWSASVP